MGIQQILAGGAPVIAAPGQIVFSQAGTHSWTAPAGVSAVSVVCVGGGGGGAGVCGWSNEVRDLEDEGQEGPL